MSVPSTSERNLLNTHPQQTKLYLSVYKPSVALMCQVNGSYSAANQSLSYDNVTSGSYTNISDYLYQVALIGSTPGDDDYGRTWVRSATNTTLRFVESDHINWQDNLYITVLKYTEIIPVFPRIIQNPANEEDVIFYKVWDIAYTNQNSILGTFICMGSNYAGFLTTGSTQVYWSASGTSNLLGESLTYSWEFEGATPSSSSSHTPGNVVYTTPGHYRTTLSVTSTSGRVDTSVRYVSIYDRPGAGPNTPVMNWELTELGGSRDGVGYTGRIKVRDTFDTDTFIDGALVVIFKEDWYGDTKQSISKNAAGRENIQFVGYINGGSIQFNYLDGYVEFEVISPTNLMEITECFSVSVESKAVPTVWYELKDMDVRRAVYHYLAWHSSVLLCCDFEARNLNDRNIQYFDADRTSLYDAVNSVVNGALRGRIMSDSLGKLWAERDISVIDSAASTLSVAGTLTKADWIDQPHIEERLLPDVSFIELGGIAYNPTTGQSTPLLASAPGSAPGYRGKVERSQGFALQDQDELNTLVGNMYASLNSRYPTVDLKLRGNFPNFDIAPQELVLLHVAQRDTPRGITWVNKAFAIRGVNWNWSSSTQVLLTSLNLTEVVQGFAGASIVIPVEPPDGDNGSVRQPPVTVPPIPPVTIPIPTGTAINIYDNNVFRGTTNNLNFIGPIVHVTMSNLSGTSTESVANIIFDACGCSGSFGGSNAVLDRPSALTGTAGYTLWSGNQVQIAFSKTSGVTRTGAFSIVTGSSTLQVSQTGMYDFSIQSIQFSTISGELSATTFDVDFDYTVTLVGPGGYTSSQSGRATFPGIPAGGNPVSLILSWNNLSIYNVYYAENQAETWRFDFSIVDRAGTLTAHPIHFSYVVFNAEMNYQG